MCLKYVTLVYVDAIIIHKFVSKITLLYNYCRSLSPRPVQMWFDDGHGGVEQGHLSLGQVG
ncbi:hypothetical protein EON65_02345 [archaeon]|nr:MAG: hypothetical protein EON65_02345 [archaeon]